MSNESSKTQEKIQAKHTTYKQAGVDINAGNMLIKRIAPIVNKTVRPEVMNGLGGFSGLCAIPTKYKEPILVSGTDGVGTKLLLANKYNQHQSIGIDLVAMCVNDLIVCGAEPLFFLDYYATSKLNIEIAEQVIKGIATGCQLAGCSLIGGETAEMPGIYKPGDYDLAGFCVGIVEKNKILTGDKIKPGHQIIGVASSGVHSNGYSLINYLLEEKKLTPHISLTDGQNIIDNLLTPTKIYTQSILNLLETEQIDGIAHITGGGILENVPRILPTGCAAKIDCTTWELPEIFKIIAEKGNIVFNELFRTFNCGIGLTLIASKEYTCNLINLLEANGESAQVIGEITTTIHQPHTILMNQ